MQLLVPLGLMMVAMVCADQKTEVTRTALHVARSLDPSTMEEMKVKTRTGEVATLLVKKRDGRQTFPFLREEIKPSDKKTNTSNSTVLEAAPNSKPQTLAFQSVPKPVIVSSEPIKTKDEVDVKPVPVVSKDTARSLDIKSQPVPAPVYITSSQVFVKGQQNEDWQNRARSLMTIDSDGIPVIEGVRVPDDESDQVVWRNARVIDGKLYPYEKSQSKHNFEIKPNLEKKKVSSQPQWVKLEQVKPIPQKESLTPFKNTWSQVPVAPPPAQEKFKPSELIAVVTTPSAQEWFEFHHPQQQNVQIIREPISPLPENDAYIRDKILGYIKRINKEELLKRQEPNRESRMIQEAQIQPQIQARVLHNPGASVYPTSLLYSPPSQQPSRVSFEGVRTPVLQYAHPELGVQPAKVVTNPEPEVTDSSKPNDRREQALAYFAHDIHADRSPYAFEPGLEDEARVEDFSNNGKRSHSGVSQRPKKTLPYFTYPDQAVTDSYKDKYYGKYSYNPNSYPSYSAYQSSADARPFWQRMSDSIKEHIQTSMDKVSDLTRPVMEPLVEASHKISKNLGLEHSGYREFNTIKEKLGVVGTPSVIFPALGLVAGGAALGLGAVAVGR